MSYTIFDLAHDMQCDLEDILSLRLAGCTKQVAENDMTVDQLRLRLNILSLAVDFFRSRPDIGGRNARDPNEVTDALALFRDFLKGRSKTDASGVDLSKHSVTSESDIMSRIIFDRPS